MTSPCALFQEGVLARVALEYGPSLKECRELLSTLTPLISRKGDGTLQGLEETRIEQSFNERLFAQLFGYETLLSNGRGTYHLMPQFPYQGRRSDFALGFFTARRQDARVACELKGPGCNLDAPQTDRRSKETPVQQAHATAPETARWVIVSNFQELRLYRHGDQDRFERIVFEDLLAPWEMLRALALFSRPTLVGTSGEDSPLDRVAIGAWKPMIEPKDGYVRLIHEARPCHSMEELSFHVMHELVGSALKAARWPQPWLPWSPRVEEDRLIHEEAYGDEPLSRLEITRSGVVRCSEYLKHVSGPRLAHRVFDFVRLATAMKTQYELTWELWDVRGKRLVETPDDWLGNQLRSPSTQLPDRVEFIRVPPQRLDNEQFGNVRFAVRELLFPFEFTDIGESVRRRPEVPEGPLRRLLGL